MTLRAFKLLFLLVLNLQLAAQYRVTGKVVSAITGLPVKNCDIFLSQKYSETTDSTGQFVFKDVAPGNYSLHGSCMEFKSIRKPISVKNQDIQINLELTPRNESLQEVVVTEQQTAFGNNRMRAVEGMGIYEGKKTEVIVLNQLTANLSTNNARQVFSRVPGLNIWENDGAGLQLSIGGRGLDPNRTSNFNVRQNGYDISADALGYPESYYTPPTEAIEKIQVVRGAASLQYGTQFGGLLNFVMNQPVKEKKLELIARQSVGSFNFYNSFTSASGTVGKLSYYTFFQYKKGDGWRPNANFTNYTAFANVNYQLSENTKLGVDYTHMYSLAKQPGGLTDDMFEANPRQSNRERNWFKVNWNLFALHFDHKFNSEHELNVRFFGLLASRDALGFRDNHVDRMDPNANRDLITGEFKNWGVEARFLKRYTLFNHNAVFLVGTRYYKGLNHSVQGLGTSDSDADFTFFEPNRFVTSSYTFPNQNLAVFAENIFYLSEKVSITPGFRTEFINTRANGYYANWYGALTEGAKSYALVDESRNSKRAFFLGGLGLSYKPSEKFDVYANISQNYRSITFNDMQIVNPASRIDPNLKDEKGYSIDLGIRSNQTRLISFDIGLFLLNYNNRIGEIQTSDAFYVPFRLRTNIGQAVIKGVEAFGELDLLHWMLPENTNLTGSLFGNLALVHSEYTNSQAVGVKGNKVEFVPTVNLKTGAKFGYKKLKGSVQTTYLSYQYTDATNALYGDLSAVAGLIPGYYVMDLSLAYAFNRFKLETSVNNLTNHYYFTRRATGYPGPGILPSDGRSFYLTLQVKI